MKVTDAAAATATTAFVLVVAPAALTITGSVSDTQVGSAVSAQFGATGGVPPYTFTVSGSIPSGASFSNGTLSGTANSPGTFQFTVVATDSLGIVASKTFTIAVTVNPLKLTGTAGNGQVGVTYSAQFGATGGAAPYTFTAGGLPPGVQLSGASLGQTPTAAGAFTVAVTVTDSTGAKASASFTVEIAPAVLTNDHTLAPRGNQRLQLFGEPHRHRRHSAVHMVGDGDSQRGDRLAGGSAERTSTESGTFTVNATVTDRRAPRPPAR